MDPSARLAFRTVSCLAIAISLATSAPPARPSTADPEHRECAFASGLGNGECQHFLRNPAGPTDDPCWCDRCRDGGKGQHHDGRTLPAGWSETLFATGGMEVYLKRHAVAWGITCSACVQSSKPWPDAGSAKGGTGPEKDFAGRPAKETVLARLEVEKKLFQKPGDVIVAYDRHFYLVTDVSGLKVRMPGGTYRPISRHEWIHLMIERCGFARREWVRHLGEPIVIRGSSKRPIAVYLAEEWKDFLRIGAAYFRQEGSNGMYGAVAELCEGMCLTGMAFSHEECREDHDFVVYARHAISHALFSMWGSLETRPKALPAWMDEGLAHWLTKTTPPFRDDAFKCAPEGGGGPSKGKPSSGGWTGKDWEEDLRDAVAADRLPPIETLLGKTTLGELKARDERRAWSWFDLCLAEWREPFVRMLADLRKEKNVREAFTGSLGCTPEVFDARWRARVLGRRRSMAPTAADADADPPDAAGARDRRSIAEESDPKALAAKVRQLGEIRDRKTVPYVVDVIARDLDLPRETALVTLLQVKDPGCRETLWTYGLAHPDPVVRAYVARICGRMRLEAALPGLEAQLRDSNWYARAEAAVACGTMKHAKAMAGLRAIVESDPSEKARVGAMDALATFGEAARAAVPAVARGLESDAWQLRVAAADALGGIGAMEGVEPLIARFEQEATGRIAEAVHRALRTITRDDLGRKPEHWRTWWDREKTRSPGGVPERPKAGGEPSGKGPAPAADDGTSTVREAPYFGVAIHSNRVAFVCDSSESMQELFTPDPAAAKALSREYVGRNKLEICKEEVVQALAGLGSRSHFNLVAFGTQVRAFRPNPVPASPENLEQARSFLKALAPAGETNYYDALKAALDLGAGPDTNPGFRSTPDTITFLTDGEPTRGDILDGEVILEWYTGLNRYARVRTHTITFGVVNVDVPLLRAMAERNGGTFTLVPERK